MKVKYRITQEVGPTQTTYELQVRYLEQVSEWQTIASSGNQSTIQAQYNNLVAAAAVETVLQESDWLTKNELDG